MKKFILLLTCIVSLYACKKNNIDNETSEPEGIPFPVATPVNGSVAGIITDENNNAVSSVQVKIGNNIIITDSNGFFNSETLILDKYINTATAEVPGYFKLYRTFSAN